MTTMMGYTMMTIIHSESNNPPYSINPAEAPEGRIVDRDCSLFGLQRLHVMRLGMPDDPDAFRDAWIRHAVGNGLVEAVLRYYDDAIQIYHLRLYWRGTDEREETVEVSE